MVYGSFLLVASTLPKALRPLHLERQPVIRAHCCCQVPAEWSSRYLWRILKKSGQAPSGVCSEVEGDPTVQFAVEDAQIAGLAAVQLDTVVRVGGYLATL